MLIFNVLGFSPIAYKWVFQRNQISMKQKLTNEFCGLKQIEHMH